MRKNRDMAVWHNWSKPELSGKRYEAAYRDLQQAIEQLRLYAGEPVLITGANAVYLQAGQQAGRKRPLGIIGGICFL